MENKVTALDTIKEIFTQAKKSFSEPYGGLTCIAIGVVEIVIKAIYDFHMGLIQGLGSFGLSVGIGLLLMAVTIIVVFSGHLIYAPISLLKDAKKSKKAVDMWPIKHHFAVLAIQGYQLSPDGFDAWDNKCRQFFMTIFGQNSHEVKVLTRSATDPAVNQGVLNQKARVELLRGGRLRHPNEVLREDSPVIHNIAVLEWAEQRYVTNNPLT